LAASYTRGSMGSWASSRYGVTSCIPASGVGLSWLDVPWTGSPRSGFFVIDTHSGPLKKLRIAEAGRATNHSLSFFWQPYTSTGSNSLSTYHCSARRGFLYLSSMIVIRVVCSAHRRFARQRLHSSYGKPELGMCCDKPRQPPSLSLRTMPPSGKIHPCCNVCMRCLWE
jgi:hypothetical protein